jgi:hypothetical protein
MASKRPESKRPESKRLESKRPESKFDDTDEDTDDDDDDGDDLISDRRIRSKRSKDDNRIKKGKKDNDDDNPGVYIRPRLYCGTKDELPGKYDYFGSRYDCLKIGMGVGKNIAGSEMARKLVKLALHHDVSLIDDETGEIKRYWDLLEDIEQRSGVTPTSV